MNIVITLFLLIIVLYYFYKFLQREHFVSSVPAPVQKANIQFMSAAETRAYLLSDPDTYIHNLSQWDLIARNVNTHDQYKDSIVATNFKEDQKTRFAKAAIVADTFFNTISLNNIDGKKIAELPWVLAMTKESTYENGLPHTRENIIFVSDAITETHESLVKTLIHEKIHIYQRAYPEDMNVFLQETGFARIKRRLGIPRIRANPDLDAWIYLNEKTGKEMYALYSSDTPHDITDIVLNDPAYEHPFELLAYKISELYK